MKCDFRFVPAAELHSVWATIRPGLEITAKRAPGNWIPEDVFMELKTGGAVLHMVIVEMRYRGFLVSKTIEHFNGKTLLLWIGYSFETGKDLLLDNIEQVKQWAANIGAKRVQWQSPRKGFAKLAPKLGFDPVLTVYECEV